LNCLRAKVEERKKSERRMGKTWRLQRRVKKNRHKEKKQRKTKAIQCRDLWVS
jgi:hypothetical protein